MNYLVLQNEVTMTSLEVVNLINKFREEEGNKKVKRHDDFMSSIRKEIKTLQALGLEGVRNFADTTYKDKQGKNRPCYKLTKEAIMMMLNKESTLVRYKTQQYIAALEDRLKQQQLPSYQIENPIDRAKAWIKEYEQKLILEQTIQTQAPKVEYHDKVLHSEKLISTTDIAKDLGMSAQKLNNKLNELGIIYKQGKVWKLYAKHQDKIPEYCDYHINEFSQTLKWTERGRKLIIDLLQDNN